MPLLRDGEIVDDRWLAPGDDDPVTPGGDVIVGLDRWRGEREAILATAGSVGLRLTSDQDPGAIAADLDRFGLIVLEFPGFADGRPFTQARDLRERHGYSGELRAGGPLVPDQYAYLLRCGIDTVAIPDGAPVEPWRAARDRFSVWLQPASDGRLHAAGLRRRRAAAEQGG